MEDQLLRTVSHVEMLYMKQQQTSMSSGDALELKSSVIKALHWLNRYDWQAPELRRLRPTSCYLRGLSHYLLEGVCITAQDHLQQAVKLQPELIAAWNCLGHCNWEQGDLLGALQCFANGVQQRANAEGLRQMSVVVRQLANEKGSDSARDTCQQEMLDVSVHAARQAVAQDVKDGYSWYMLGLSQLASCFAGGSVRGPPQQQQQLGRHSLTELQQVVNALQRAQQLGLTQLADLYYNRAVVHLYLQRFQDSLEDFAQAGELDPSLPWEQQATSIGRFVAQLAHGVAHNAKLKPKQLSEVVAQIAREGGKRQLLSNCTQTKLADLKPGRNVGCALLCKPVMTLEPPPGAAATYYLALGPGGSCFALALLGMPELPYRTTTTAAAGLMTILNPSVEHVCVSWDNKEYRYTCVKVEEWHSVLVDHVPLEARARRSVMQRSFVTHANSASNASPVQPVAVGQTDISH